MNREKEEALLMLGKPLPKKRKEIKMSTRQRNTTLLLALALAWLSCVGCWPSLTVGQVLQAFEDAGLECEDPQSVLEPIEPPEAEASAEAVRCAAPSIGDGQEVWIFAFDNGRDLEAARRYYDRSGVFGSYVYVRGNLLLRISVKMPKRWVERYREAFETFQP